MDGLLLVARLLLAGVFAVAGAAKLADRAGTRRAIADFGAPAGLAGPLSVILPMAEVAIAIALLPRFSAWLAAAAALVLLITLLAATIFNLVQGRRPDCRCFGQLHAVPIGSSTVALNLGLMGVAGLLVWWGDSNPSARVAAWIAGLSPSGRTAFMAAAVVLGALSTTVVLMGRTVRRQGRRIDELERRLAEKPWGAASEEDEGLPVGSAAPRFKLAALGGGVVTLDSLLAGQKPVLLVFTNPHCGPCEAMLPTLARWQRDYENQVAITVVSEGTAADNHPKAIRFGLRRVLLQQEDEVASAYLCQGAPGAVLVQIDGTIGSFVAGGLDQIARLVSSIAGVPTDTVAGTGPLGRRSLHILGRGAAGAN